MTKNTIKTLDLGETFKQKNNIFEGAYYQGFKTLDECYARASYEKERIYKKYYNLLLDNADDVLKYGVKTYNTFMITLHAEVIKDGKKYYLYITPSYNYFVEIEG